MLKSEIDKRSAPHKEISLLCEIQNVGRPPFQHQVIHFFPMKKSDVTVSLSCRTKIAAKPAPVPEVRKEVRTLKKRQHRKKTIGVEKNTEAIPAFDWAGVELKEFRKSFTDVSAYNTASRKYNEETLRKYYNDAEARTMTTSTPVTTESGTVGPAMVAAPLKPPMVTFTQTPFPASFHTELKRQGFDKPHPIFAITWPHILSGQNFVGVSQSGPWSLAYVLPCLVHINDQLVKTKGVEMKPEDFGPIAIVVTHSQARGEQLLEQFQKFGALLNITSQLVYGEKPEDLEADPHSIALKENPNVVVVVCGPKMNEMILKKKLNLKRCTFLVFDDATLLHKFGRSLENVLGQVRPDRQLVMWNTTFGSSNGNAQEAIKVAKKFNFVDYMRIFFGTYSHFYNPNTVKHVVDFFIPDGERDLRFMLTIQTILTAAAASAKKPNILVFCNTLAKSRKACDALQRTGILSKCFQTKNPIPHPVNEKTAKTTTTTTKPTVVAPTPAAKEEGAGDESVTEEKPANAEPVTFEQQLEINQREFSENKLYQIWIANDANPLAELDFSEFDCIVHYDFPARHELYEERAAKFLEEAGRGAVYTLILESSDHELTKYLSNYLLAQNQVK
jgi:DEAD/DEAH box helicase